MSVMNNVTLLTIHIQCCNFLRYLLVVCQVVKTPGSEFQVATSSQGSGQRVDRGHPQSLISSLCKSVAAWLKIMNEYRTFSTRRTNTNLTLISFQAVFISFVTLQFCGHCNQADYPYKE